MDHPRVCGEYAVKPIDGQGIGGSSPRLRGVLRLMLPAGRVGGIIPASAGSTKLATPERVAFRDHPRVCGEYAYRKLAYRKLAGSSPRLRGVQSILTTGLSDGGDHPRVCGEY